MTCTSARLLLSWVLYITVSHLTRADPFYCDTGIISDIEPLFSYSYTCDGIAQCIDRRDEAGCVDCSSGRLLLTGLEPASNLFQYETTFELQHYKLRNRAVYRTSEGSLKGGYITYNDFEDRWELSTQADKGTVLVSSQTTVTQPFLTGISWRLPEKDEILPNVGLECVSSEIRKCYGNIVVVSPTKVLKLGLGDGGHYLNYRPIYTNEEYALKYVLSSDSWDTPHWQITNIGTGEEVMVFLGSRALYPEYTNTPGLYKSAEGTWIKSSNVYVTCDVLRREEPHPIDCLFETSTCDWKIRQPGDSAMVQGAAEEFSLGHRLPPTLYVLADRGTTPGKYKITSPAFYMDTESCLLVKFASTVLPPDTDSTVTINIQDLFSNDVIYELGKCTNKDNHHCSRIVSYKTEKISLTLADNAPKQNAKIIITIRMELNEQPSGVVSLAETALINQPCDSVVLDLIDTCNDLDYPWPCDADTCRSAGLRGYQCECESSTNYGPHCESEQSSCPQGEDVEKMETMTSLKGYRGYDVLFFTCQDGFQLHGDNPRCQRDGSYTTYPSCVEVQCPVLDLPHATTTSTPSTVTVQCHEGFHPADKQTVECVKGEYSSTPLPCLLDCSYPGDSTTVISDSDSTTIRVDLEACEYATDSATTNYTNCVMGSHRTRVPGTVAMSTDISVSVDGEGKLCVRFANYTSQSRLDCAEKCVVSGVLKLVRVVEGGPQFIEVVTDFDYSKEKLINNFGLNASVSLSTLIIGFLVMILT